VPAPDVQHTGQVRAYFDRRVAAYDAFYDPPSPLARWFNRVFRKAVYLRRDEALRVTLSAGCQTMLDVGCGSGQNTVYFARHGVPRILGVDISPEMTQLAGQLAARAGVADQCRFQTLDFLALTPTERYDSVVACGVFDYVQRADAFLAHMARFANRIINGSFPGWTLVRTPLRKVRYALRGCPTHFYRRAEIEGLFRNVGFGRVSVLPVPSGHLAWAVKS
jgi:2-polyprenyl-3-methyl-5-hydroxy-6-metoxy-1,4-benzoquinol methylase